MEIMGKKPHNPILLGLMEKVRPNTYRLTPRGRTEAKRLRTGEEKAARRPAPAAASSKSSSSDVDFYTSVAGYVAHPTFQRWREDPDEPRRWSDVVAFFAADPDDDDDVAKRYKQAKARTRAAIDHCNKSEIEALTKDPQRTHPPIHFNVLAEMIDFLQALTYRFPQLEGEGGTKHRLPPKG
jgi:hypothetical protein